MPASFFAKEGIEFFQECFPEELLILRKDKWDRLAEKIGGIESVFLFLIPYFSGQTTTNLSVYAQPKDYHLYVKELSSRFAEYMQEKYPGIGVLGCADNSPIQERDAALRAGLGVQGKNGLVLNPVYGSFFFIGEFFLNRAIAPERGGEIAPCPGCGACLAACPTGAIENPARERCLSRISQKKKWTPQEAALMETTSCKWGCDLCQSACPINRGAQTTPIPFFQTDLIRELDEAAISAPEEVFSQRAYSWRGREVLRRNLKKK